MVKEIPSNLLDTPRILETYSHLLRDPLTQATRRERRSLVGVSAIALLIAVTGWIPKEISTLGIQIKPESHAVFFTLLALVVVYLLVGFISYAASDYLDWRNRLDQARLFTLGNWASRAALKIATDSSDQARSATLKTQLRAGCGMLSSRERLPMCILEIIETFSRVTAWNMHTMCFAMTLLVF